MRIVVTGTQGQVVQSLIERAENAAVDVVALGRPDLDLARLETIAPVLAAARPDIIVSAAAYTAVDKAEDEPDLAMAVNGHGAGAVARAAAQCGVPVVHLSTDYVFAGSGETPFREDDPVGPASSYGRSKLAGEQAVAAATDDHCILRTAWVYSPFGANFVKTMLRVAATRPELRVVADQFGSPTSALDIADGVITVCRNLLGRRDDDRLRGVFHMAGTGYTHWAGFAAEIFACSQALGGPRADVVPITTADYPTPAKRPANSRLDCSKLEHNHGVRLPRWQESTAAVVARLLAAAPATRNGSA